MQAAHAASAPNHRTSVRVKREDRAAKLRKLGITEGSYHAMLVHYELQVRYVFLQKTSSSLTVSRAADCPLVRF